MKLTDILSTTRPAWSEGENKYIERLLQTIRNMGHDPVTDKHGNISVNLLPTSPTKSMVMFTSHTDSVHQIDTITQSITQDKDGMISVTSSSSTCLGADDGTGNYIMLHLLKHNIPALYVFFRAEEIGGIGSRNFVNDATNHALIDTITHCVSFDRKGYDSVITHQGARCCSDKFASELSAMLNSVNDTFSFSPDDGGIFTDSANFTHLISECTNLSVGYHNAHTNRELQDANFVEELNKALVKIDWSNLSSYRNPSDYDYDYFDDDYDYFDEDTIEDIRIGGEDYTYDMVINDPKFTSELLYRLCTRG